MCLPAGWVIFCTPVTCPSVVDSETTAVAPPGEGQQWNRGRGLHALQPWNHLTQKTVLSIIAARPDGRGAMSEDLNSNMQKRDTIGAVTVHRPLK